MLAAPAESVARASRVPTTIQIIINPEARAPSTELPPAAPKTAEPPPTANPNSGADGIEAPRSRIATALDLLRQGGRHAALLAGGGGAAAALWMGVRTFVESGVLLSAPMAVNAALGVGALAAGFGLRYLLRAGETERTHHERRHGEDGGDGHAWRHRRGGARRAIGRAAGALGTVGFLGGAGVAGYSIATAGMASALVAVPPLAILGGAVALGSALVGGALYKALAGRRY